MKKILSLILAVALELSLTACGGGAGSGSTATDREQEKPSAILTVTKADGTTETLTIEEMKKIYNDNEVNYNNNYKGCEVIVEGVVEGIEQEEKKIFGIIRAETAVFTLGEITGIKFWIVMGDNHYKDLDFSTIEKGTRVRAAGTLGEIFVFIDIDAAHDFEIISE